MTTTMNAARYGWALKYYSKCKLDGVREYLLMNQTFYGKNVAIFKTRQQARDFRDEYYGYIRDRPDLKAEPHGWTVPKVVKVVLTMTEIQ